MVVLALPDRVELLGILAGLERREIQEAADKQELREHGVPLAVLEVPDKQDNVD